MGNKISTMTRTRWYFLLRAGATVGDYAVYWAFFFAYVRYFGAETEDGFRVSGCGHGLALVAAWVVLMPLPEAFWGRTFGKWACGLRVVGVDNRPVTIGQAFARRLLDPVDLLAFFGLVAYIVAKTNPLSQRLGDLVAKTRVVDEAEIASVAAER
jgi:uncharacterized RDD family membrane protein YckC